MLQIADQDIGGAKVRRVFMYHGEFLKANRYLSADEVLAIPIANRRALCDAGFLEVFPKSSPAKNPHTKRLVLRGREGEKGFQVFEGHIIHGEHEYFTKSEADRLAGRGNGKS
jgi:hypothetical protein